jgi:hypothetical protein
VAYEIAAKLAPDDPRPREALARLHAEDPASWQQAALALRESWRLQPDDPGPLQSLLTLHLDGNRWDSALSVASVLTLRGIDDPRAADLMRRFQTRFLQRIGRRVDAAVLDKLRHPDEDGDLAQVLAHVFSVHQVPFTLGDLGVAESDRLADEAQPATFRRVLAYVAALLGVPAPPVYRRADFGAQAHVGAMAQPVLLVGPEALATERDLDKLALGFRLGRALSFLWPGRAMASALPPRQLKSLLLAAVTLASPGLAVEDADGQIAAQRALLAQTPALAQKLAPMVERLLKGSQATLSLTRYSRGLSRTADRVGLLLCNDLGTAARAVDEAGGPEAADELLDFALSTEYTEAKEALGLSIAV